MAEVFGQFGDQPIQLNNAATEATLKEILAAIMKAGIAGKGGKASKETEEKLKKLAKQVDELNDAQKEALKIQEEANKQSEEAKKQKEKELESAKKLGIAYNTLLDTVTGVITGMTNVMSTLSRLDNSLTSAAQSLSAIPVVGTTLSTVFGAVAGAAERSYKAFQQAASIGANFGGSITDMINSAAGAGLTFDQFSGIISRTGENLALLGGNTSQGAKRLAELGKEIRGSRIGDELARMGYSTEQINESMAKYSGILAKTGALENMTNAQLVQQTGQYLTNLDAVSKLTGQNKKDLEEQRAQMLRDAQIRNTLRKMDKTSQEELMAFLQTMPPELQEGAKEVIATGTATSDAGKAFLTYMNKTGTSFVALNGQIRNTGKFTRENAQELNSMMQREAKEMSQSDLAENQRLFGDKYNQALMVGIDDMAARQQTLAQTQAQQQKDAEERAKKEKELKDKEIDPASMKTYQEKIAQVSNEFTKLLANSNMLNGMMKVFEVMVKFIEFTVVPAFTFLSNNLGLVAAVLAPLVGLVALVNTSMAILDFQTKLRTLTEAGATSATARLALAATAPILGLFKLAAAAFAASLPFLKIVAPILLALAAFKYLYEAGFTVGDVFEAFGDGLKKLMITLADGFLWLLDKVTFGDANKKIKEAQKALDLEREELKEKEKARDQRRKEKREERGIKEEENKVTKEGIDLQKKENEEKKAAAATPTTPGGAYDLSSPEEMFKSAMRRQQGAAAQPGATGAASGAVPGGLGGLAAKFESGSAGSSAVGWDSTGGTSFGKYQIASKTGTMDRFMEHLKKTNPEAYERLSKAGPADSGKEGKFAQEWKKLAGEGKLQQSEHEFIKATHFDVGMKGTGQSLQNMIGQSKALQEVMWSTSVQHGGKGASDIFNKVFKEGMSEKDLIDAVYAERSKKFGSSSQQVQASVMNRFAQERQLAQGLVGQPGTAVASATPATPATPSATAAQTAVAQAPAPAPQQPAAPAPVQTAQASRVTQDDAVQALASLNTKMDVLIALNRKANDTRDRQLSATKSSPTDVSAWAAA